MIVNSFFVTGIGTDVGKTITAAILAEALKADYWKPVQAGFDEGTDSEFIRSVISNKRAIVYPETYKLKLAASPHIAARDEGVNIDLDKICEDHLKIVSGQWSIVSENPSTLYSPLPIHNLIIEGAGGLLVPLNKNELVVDLIKKLNAKVILVSRNYLGSINHSLLTAAVCKQNNLKVSGWIFNDHYMNYEDEIVQWSGYPKIASIPFTENPNREFVYNQSILLKPKIELFL